MRVYTLTMDAAKSAGVTFVRVYTLTTTAEANGSIDPAPGRHAYDEGSSVTLTATPDPGYQVAAWEGACSAVVAPATTCALTMDADQTAGVTFVRVVRVYTLTVAVTGDGGQVTPSGTATHPDGAVVPLQASWNDATHRFTGWGGACSGTASTCELTMDADRTVTATFAALAADRCATPGAADCLRAVYRGAPGDYAQVADIPADRLVPPGRRRPLHGGPGPAVHGRHGRPPADRLHPLLPAMAARGPALRHERGAADPARGHDLHLHPHRPTRPGPP